MLLRRTMFEQMERVARGEDPLGVIRDPNYPIVDTNIDEDVWQQQPSHRWGTVRA